jgi:hypothetical protein
MEEGREGGEGGRKRGRREGGWEREEGRDLSKCYPNFILPSIPPPLCTYLFLCIYSSHPTNDK